MVCIIMAGPADVSVIRFQNHSFIVSKTTRISSNNKFNNMLTKRKEVISLRVILNFLKWIRTF